MFKLEEQLNGFKLLLNEEVILNHTSDAPCVYLGKGEESFSEYRGNYEVSDYVEERIPLSIAKLCDNNIEFFRFEQDEEAALVMSLTEEGTGDNGDCGLSLVFEPKNMTYNRFWLRISAEGEDRIYGLGEQMSYFNLRGRDFPVLTSEPGVGRDKSTYTTFLADTLDKAGGDYYTSNYPEPTFISSKDYWCHVDSTAYGVFDFTKDNFHEIMFYEIPQSIVFKASNTLLDTVKSLADYAGKLPPLPDWVHDGIILGVQGGTEIVDHYLEQAVDHDIKVTGLFCQDWEGINITSFGQRLYWNWMWDEKRYPQLKERIKNYHDRGVKFLGYINPNVVKNGSLYIEAADKGYLALNKKGQVYDIDFGEFDCGAVDFTNPDAFEWYKSVIRTYLLDFGLDGWMADFGEYLPMDCVLHNGVDAKVMHNAWPALWAKCNYEAVEEAGKLGDILYFMRAGGFGSQKYCVSLWAGDQSVDWSRHDGIGTVISGALSSGMMANPYHHSDIGGYTSLHGNIRSKELFMRWMEMATFTSVLRTHEGNRPSENFQYYNDEETMEHMKKFVDIRVALKPYFKALDIEGSRYGSGLPMQRPLVMHYEDDPETYELQTEFLVGEDLLVAPVLEAELDEIEVYIPEGEWLHLWTKELYTKGTHLISAKIGFIPVFYKKDSSFTELFDRVAK